MPSMSAWGVESEPKDPSVDGMPGFCLASFNNTVPLRPRVSGCWGMGIDRVQFGTTNFGVSPRPLTVILSKQLSPRFQNFDLLSVQICKGYLRQSWLPLRLRSAFTPRESHCCQPLALFCPSPIKLGMSAPNSSWSLRSLNPTLQEGCVEALGGWMLLYWAGPEKKSCF